MKKVPTHFENFLSRTALLRQEMGVQLDETDLSELEPQIFKIFKKQLGFFDGEILSNTMGAIHEGVDRAGLEQRLANTVEKKKAQKLIDEVTEVYFAITAVCPPLILLSARFGRL